MINVTKTFLPPMEEYVAQLERIWASGQLTNNGPLLRELEQKLRDYFGVKHLFLVANGTIGLQIALKALDIKRKVITTPFSYVATTGAVLWENVTPVFADINSRDYCIDPDRVEALIDQDVEAILAVHVYGNACDVVALEEIARKHEIKVIYDAAHAFGSRLNGESLVACGDVSVLSFHATKLFHTVEGGAVITDDDEVARKIRLHRAFGHIRDDYFTLGINGKNSEFHAAMGLCVLPHIPKLLSLRKSVSQEYDRLIEGLPITRPQSSIDGFEYNHAYYPVLFPAEEQLLAAKELLEKKDIVPRRYFYPALNRLPYLEGEPCPVAEDIAARVLCLPLSHEVTPEDQSLVVRLIAESLSR
jgi:dTDP-4-amino-4,6-dideoxygalactose transaminase